MVQKRGRQKINALLRFDLFQSIPLKRSFVPHDRADGLLQVVGMVTLLLADEELVDEFQPRPILLAFILSVLCQLGVPGYRPWGTV